jgi:Contractile injection system tube protein
MERIAFLIEHTGVRLSCLLNPETLVIRRTAGIRPRFSTGGQLTSARLSDEALLYTGGGSSELQLDLLFDVTLAGSSMVTEDVGELTRPLSELAENSMRQDGVRRPPLVRFVWGKAWNILGVVAAVAERVEYFTAAGAPRRSWLRMRLLRVDETTASQTRVASAAASIPQVAPDTPIPGAQRRVHQVLGGRGQRSGATGGAGQLDPSQGGPAERLDEIAHREYGDPRYWRVIASLNNIDDPLHIPEGQVLSVPPLSALERPR